MIRGTTLPKILARCYEEEINVSVSSFFDEGWTVKIGDPINGYRAETTVERIGDVAGWIKVTVFEIWAIRL